MTGTEAKLARDAYCTKSEVFASEALRTFRGQPDLQGLDPAQWGAIRAVLSDRGREPTEALAAHFAHQRAKAEKRGRIRLAAAFASLHEALRLTGGLAEIQSGEACDLLTAAFGETFDREAFSLAFGRAAIEGFFLNLTRLMAITRELQLCLID